MMMMMMILYFMDFFYIVTVCNLQYKSFVNKHNKITSSDPSPSYNLFDNIIIFLFSCLQVNELNIHHK